MINNIIILGLIFIIISCIIKIIYLKRRNKKLNSDTVKIILALKRARYGDINVRVGELNMQELEKSVNKLLEAMYDREMMIKEYQSALSKKNLSLEEVIKQEKELQLLKEEFTATLTHDMKVPVIAELNSINYLLDLRYGTLNEKQIQILELMKSSNQELKELIENILEIYKLDKKEIDLNLSKNNLNEFLTSVTKEMEPITTKTNHSFQLELSQTKNKEVYFDTFQLKRVIKNLIQNAITYTPMKEKIIIETKNENNTIKIEITNKGSSISEKDLDLIFKKYYQGHSKFRKAGTGLGLYLSQQIMLAHRGNISLDNSKKGYTTFCVKLPV